MPNWSCAGAEVLLQRGDCQACQAFLGPPPCSPSPACWSHPAGSGTSAPAEEIAGPTARVQCAEHRKDAVSTSYISFLGQTETNVTHNAVEYGSKD